MVADNDHGNAVNMSAVGITVAVFAAIACHIMLNMLGVGVGVLAATRPDNVDPEAASWAVFAWWAAAGIVSSFTGGWVAGWIAAERNGSPGMHGIAMWAVTTVIVVAAASMIAAVGGTMLGHLAGPGFVNGSNTESTTAESAAIAGTMAIASFVALLIGLVAAYIGAQMGAQRETRHHHHHHMGVERVHTP